MWTHFLSSLLEKLTGRSRRNHRRASLFTLYLREFNAPRWGGRLR
jgi:hypothetical protein